MFIQVIRGKVEDAAKRHGERTEQDAFWNATKDDFDGEPTFYNCPTVDVAMGGGSDDAGFVQVMIDKVSDVGKARELSARFTEGAPAELQRMMEEFSKVASDIESFDLRDPWLHSP